MKHLALAIALVATPACAAKPQPQPVPVNGWYQGPQVGSFNYSPGITLAPLAGGVLQTDIPMFYDPKRSNVPVSQLDALVHPVAMLPDSMTVAYSLSAPVRATDAQSVGFPAQISVMFQRCGDNWSGTGDYAYYRWFYWPGINLVPGSNIFSVDFTDPSKWTSVTGNTMGSGNLSAFNMARLNVCNVEIVFGWNGGMSHGVAGLNGPAHFNLLGAQ